MSNTALKDIYIVITDKSGNEAMNIKLDTSSEEFDDLLKEKYALLRITEEAILGTMIGDEITG